MWHLKFCLSHQHWNILCICYNHSTERVGLYIMLCIHVHKWATCSFCKRSKKWQFNSLTSIERSLLIIQLWSCYSGGPSTSAITTGHSLEVEPSISFLGTCAENIWMFNELEWEIYNQIKVNVCETTVCNIHNLELFSF